jgi:PTS system mannose-specific IID component
VGGWEPDIVHGGHREIGVADLMRVFVRGLLLQASWSFERMQSLGFAYAVEPALRKLYPDQQEYESRLRLHMTYFNTQPYLASYILGAVVRLEQERASGRKPDADVQGLKTSLMAPLGALGDSFFWGALKPLAAVGAVALIMTGYWWAPLLFLLFYNVWHLGLRAAMLFWGYTSRGNAMELMSRFSFMKMAKRFKVITLTILGGIIGMVPDWRPEFHTKDNVSALPLMALWLAVVLALVAIPRRGGSPIKLMLGLAVFCLALVYAGVIV